MLIFDLDDWSVIHDCRDKLEELKKINPNFKVTLFTVPGKTTIEMLLWASSKNWVELGCQRSSVHPSDGLEPLPV